LFETERYTPKSKNALQTILKKHFADFETSYEEKYAQHYGKFKLEAISEKVTRFLECGDYTKGVAKIVCGNSNCSHKYFLPFSCKSWYLCPSCHQKRLQLFSERMNEEVLLKLPHRQFVFTLPKMLRVFFKHNGKLFVEISKMIVSIMTDYYNSVSRKTLQSGFVVSYQTYGDMLRFNPHWHCIIMEGGLDAQGNFYYLPIKDTAKLCELFRRKVVQYFINNRLLDEKRANMILSWINSGFSVDNSVQIFSTDDKARENVSQYIARHPVSLKKILYEPTKGRVIYHTKYNDYFKENVKVFEATDFIAELTQHIPPRNKHYIRYYGLYSSRGKGKVRAEGKLNHFLPNGVKGKQVPMVSSEDDTPWKKKQKSVWARLVQKVFAVNPLECPKCGSEMAIKAFIFDRESLEKIVAWMIQKNKLERQTNKSPPMKKLISAVG